MFAAFKMFFLRKQLVLVHNFPWSDVKSLRPKWTKDNRPSPPDDAHPSSLKTPADFQELVDAREARAQKRKEAKPRKEPAAAAERAQQTGRSDKPKAGNKSAKRKKKLVIVSQPEAASEEEANSDYQDSVTEADVEDI